MVVGWRMRWLCLVHLNGRNGRTWWWCCCSCRRETGMRGWRRMLDDPFLRIVIDIVQSYFKGCGPTRRQWHSSRLWFLFGGGTHILKCCVFLVSASSQVKHLPLGGSSGQRHACLLAWTFLLRCWVVGKRVPTNEKRAVVC